MRGIKRSAVVLAAVSVATALAPAASAQEDVTPRFSGLGGTFRIDTDFGIMIEEGTCPGGPVSLTSPGFAGPVDLTTLRGRFGKVPGSYTATLKCKDTTEVGTDTFELVAPPPPDTDPFLDKKEYAPGETITIAAAKAYKCGYEAISEGFVAPAKLTYTHGTQTLHGKAVAIDAPGTYEAKIQCLYGYKSNTFTIRIPTTTPPPGPGPKPPIVKPKGAPQTGGGGTPESRR